MRGFGFSQAIGWVCSTGCALLYFGFHLSLALRHSNVSWLHFCFCVSLLDVSEIPPSIKKSIGCHRFLYSCFSKVDVYGVVVVSFHRLLEFQI
ncbi:hypothetical protein BZA77DRAFT_136316 [Pyronema omphalodes]|nr:hypothetical protein BZA77DRAFT_136316 [Pyronema omphalodes]